MTDNFINQIGNKHPLENENAYNSIIEEYERIIIQSLITSFGLDFLINDQYGGDVDTVHNVRQVGQDKQMRYKSEKNKKKYDTQDDYDYGAYHRGGNFQQRKHESREKWQATGKNIKDEYTNKDIGFYGHTNAIPPNKKAELDHIIAAKEVHDDRGRVLSGLAGKELVDSEDNLAWTNKSLNASMQSKNIESYIASHPELDEDTKQRMLAKDERARKSYNTKINQTYYTSSLFVKDTTKAAAKVGLAMGLRQVLGLVFSEIWFAVRDEIKADKKDGEALFHSIAKGIDKGYQNAKNKHKDLWKKFIEGSVAGVLASLTTTLCNIFFTTAKNLIRILRQTWASLVEATKIVLFNPDCLPFGERFRAASKIIATGASVVVGLTIGDMIAKTGIGAIPIVGEIVQVFCSTLVTGIMSCSLLYLLDRNSTINKLVNTLNSIPTIDDLVLYHQMQAKLLEGYCAKIMDIDLGRFQKETKSYHDALLILENVNGQKELNFALNNIYKRLGFNSPFEKSGNIDSFMANKNNKLSFF